MSKQIIRDLIQPWMVARSVRTPRNKFKYSHLRSIDWYTDDKLKQIAYYKRVRSLPLLGDKYALTKVVIEHHNGGCIEVVYNLSFEESISKDYDIGWNGDHVDKKYIKFYNFASFRDLIKNYLIK